MGKPFPHKYYIYMIVFLFIIKLIFYLSNIDFVTVLPHYLD